MRQVFALGQTVVAGLALFCAGCNRAPPVPPVVSFEGLPVSGDWQSAWAAGFNRCIYVDAISMRCRKAGVELFGAGPYEAAVDLLGRNGRGGFRQLTLWHDGDQRALYDAIVELAERGWRFCHTGSDRAGDQAIFTRPDTAFKIYMDISYWGKRRLRIFPNAFAPRPSTPCIPEKSLGLFGLNVTI